MNNTHKIYLGIFLTLFVALLWSVVPSQPSVAVERINYVNDPVLAAKLSEFRVEALKSEASARAEAVKAKAKSDAEDASKRESCHRYAYGRWSALRKNFVLEYSNGKVSQHEPSENELMEYYGSDCPQLKH